MYVCMYVCIKVVFLRHLKTVIPLQVTSPQDRDFSSGTDSIQQHSRACACVCTCVWTYIYIPTWLCCRLLTRTCASKFKGNAIVIFVIVKWWRHTTWLARQSAVEPAFSLCYMRDTSTALSDIKLKYKLVYMEFNYYVIYHNPFILLILYDTVNRNKVSI
jgi:hypothetical protein